MRGLLGLPLVLLHLLHAASLAVIDQEQQQNFSILRSAYVDALFQRRSAFNTTCSETEVHHKEGSYFVCSLLSRNKTTEEHTAGRVRPICLVVSVGIGGIWNLEDMLAARSCTVVAFDPTKEMKTVHQMHARAKRNVHFHYLGLGASPDVETTLAAAKVITRLGLKPYGSLDTRVIVPLAEIFRIARETVARSAGGHDLLEVDADRYNQTIDLLKIDCEGCEWDAFEDLVARTPHLLRGVKQIIIELHMRAGISEDAIPSPLQEASSWFDSFFINRTQYAGWHMSTGFGLIAPQQFDTLMHHLLIDHDFRVAHAVQHSGQAGGRTMKYNQPPPGLREAGFPINKFCCVEMTLVREHD